ncbi:MAG TPA: autotransporter domain-containing protein [Devosia sp.]|nr:autotransporter domain-containing protein [Devosia sp.]
MTSVSERSLPAVARLLSQDLRDSGTASKVKVSQIVLPDLAARTAQGRTGANQFLGQVEAGYRIGLHEPAAPSVTPFTRFQGMTNSQYGFTESGAGALHSMAACARRGGRRVAFRTIARRPAAQLSGNPEFGRAGQLAHHTFGQLFRASLDIDQGHPL